MEILGDNHTNTIMIHTNISVKIIQILSAALVLANGGGQTVQEEQLPDGAGMIL